VAKWTKWVAIFTKLLFFANAAGLYLIGKQWQTAANTQADNREQLRALVSLSNNITVLPANFVEHKPTIYAFIANFHNFGGTRTARFTAWVSIKYFDGEVPNNQDFSKPYNKMDNIRDSVIAPGGDNQVAPVAVTSDEVGKAVSKQGVIVLWGRVEWADIFNPSQIHHISFCFSPNPTPISPATPVPAPVEQSQPSKVEEGGSSTFRPDFAFQPAPFRAECNASD
jgi:hypothetical protein